MQVSTAPSLGRLDRRCISSLTLFSAPKSPWAGLPFAFRANPCPAAQAMSNPPSSRTAAAAAAPTAGGGSNGRPLAAAASAAGGLLARPARRVAARALGLLQDDSLLLSLRIRLLVLLYAFCWADNSALILSMYLVMHEGLNSDWLQERIGEAADNVGQTCVPAGPRSG